MDKEQVAIERLKTASEMSLTVYQQPLVVTTSGGKDSSVCVVLAERAGIPFEVMHNHTTVDAPETVRFVREDFRRLELKGVKCIVNYPVYKGKRTSMWKLIPQQQIPPMRIARYCCNILKERGGAGRFITTGVRWDESRNRRKNRGIYEAERKVILNNDNDDRRRLFETCALKATRVCNPIIDWTDADIWAYIEAEKLPVNPLYQCGFSRVGCIDCPMAGTKMRQKEFALYPEYRRNYILAFERMLKERERSGKMQGNWNMLATGEDVFHWWIEDGVVPGTFSSNKGNDFRAVLEETIRIAEPDAPDVPLPAKGKWPLADCWYGDGWPVAYRVLDAQFWGVPQRRRRIALVADFGGHAAPEILFVRKGVCGDIAESEAAGKETAAGAGSGTYPAIARNLTARYDGSPCIDRGPDIVWCLQGNAVDRDAKMNGAGTVREPMFTLNTVDRHAVYQAGSVHQNQCAGFKHKAGAKAGNIGYEAEIASTLNAEQTTAVYDARGNGDEKTACTLTGGHQSRVTDYTAIVMATRQTGAEITWDMVPTLNYNHEQPIVMGIDAENNCLEEKCGTLRTHCSGGAEEKAYQYGLVRRLTPLECERLQGYPDNWTDSKGKLHKE